MSRAILLAAEQRAAEQALVARGTGEATLMARAGEAVATAVQRFGNGAAALVLCGPGNNGGDGYVAAARLRAQGVPVRVAALRPPRTPAAQAAAAEWGGPVDMLDDAAPAPVLVDALFGTGLARPLEPLVATTLARLGAEARWRLAVDLPSGIEADTGATLGAPFAADLTLALGALKPAHRLQPAAGLVGTVLVADLGLDLAAAQLQEIAPPRLRPPPADASKYSRGKLVVVGGGMGGAALLAATAAQRAGAGYVELLNDAAGPAPHALVQRRYAADALADPRVHALAIGPGLGTDDVGRDRLAAVLAQDKPTALDADALTIIGREDHARLRGRVVTPHWGEFTRLFGDSGADRLTQARAAAQASRAVVLLKGSDTIVAHPDGRAAINPPAPSWLASAGTGDVLTGIIGGLLAQGLDPFAAAQAGAWAHAAAARAAGPFLVADDLVAALPGVLATCL